MAIVTTERHVVVNCLLDHRIVVFALGPDGTPLSQESAQITHDGPFWGLDAVETDRGLTLAAGGVEDHPLDRRGGFFGYIDSFVFLYRVGAAAHLVQPLGAVNVSAHGVITPKAIALEVNGDRAEVTAIGYGGERGVRLVFEGDASTAVEFAVPAGIRAMGAGARSDRVMPDPLLDAWVILRDDSATLVPIEDAFDSRTRAEKLGEALFFTSLMAPWNRSDGALSRFAC